MAIIYESKNFIVEAFEHPPHIDRNDGGHVMITPKKRVSDRLQLAPQHAIELMRLTMVAGQAMMTVMNAHGVAIGRINFQENGNWSVFEAEGPYLHVHLYGRAKSAKAQKYGEALFFPNTKKHPEYYKNFKPLNADDVKDMQIEIERLLKEEKFSDVSWGIS